MSYSERLGFFDRIIKKYKKISDDFDNFFNEDLIERLVVKVENNWKYKLLNWFNNIFL